MCFTVAIVFFQLVEKVIFHMFSSCQRETISPRLQDREERETTKRKNQNPTIRTLRRFSPPLYLLCSALDLAQRRRARRSPRRPPPLPRTDATWAAPQGPYQRGNASLFGMVPRLFIPAEYRVHRVWTYQQTQRQVLLAYMQESLLSRSLRLIRQRWRNSLAYTCPSISSVRTMLVSS